MRGSEEDEDEDENVCFSGCSCLFCCLTRYPAVNRRPCKEIDELKMVRVLYPAPFCA